MQLFEILKEIDNGISGNININTEEDVVKIFGNISTSKKDKIEKAINEYAKNKYKVFTLDLSYDGLVVNEDGHITGQTIQDEIEIDEVKILYQGMMNIKNIKRREHFKLINPNNKIKIRNSVRVMNFLSPIVLNQNLEVIDGDMRLTLAKENKIDTVPVIVIEVSEIQANTLSLTLNRSSEFQRWNYREVDDFIDETPQIQGIVEPLGFFGKNVLPESYFSPTILKYEIDPFNHKQMQYDQEPAIAKYAEIRRKELEEKAKKKHEVPKPKEKPTVSIFDLKPEKEDFLETYNIDEEMNKMVKKYEKIGNKITNKLDEEKRKEIEEKGGDWQTNRRNPSEVVDAKKKDFVKRIKNSKSLTDEEKETVLNNMDNYANMNVKEIKKSFEE